MDVIISNHQYGLLQSLPSSYILRYLEGKPLTEETGAVFSWVVGKVDLMFLIRNPDYITIYQQFGGRIDLPIPDTPFTISELMIDQKEERSLYQIYGSELPKYGTSLSGFEDPKLLRNMVYYGRLKDLDLQLESHMKAVADYLDETTSINGGLETKIRSYYYNHHLACANVDDLRRILQWLPDGKLSMAIARFGDVYPIAYHTTPVQAYLSEFPIHEMSPSLFETTTGDRKEILERVNERHKTELRMFGVVSDPFQNKLVKPEDSINQVDIADYSPFDVVRYLTGTGKISQLCRTEFDHIIKFGTDPMTREIIPNSTMMEIKKRQKLAKMWDLPQAEPLRDLLDKIERPVVQPSSYVYGSVRIMPRPTSMSEDDKA